MCFQRNYDRTKDISDMSISQIEELMPYLETLHWQGGEAFLYKDFDRLYAKAATYKNITNIVTTNGLLINERWSEILTSSNLNLIFSIDGITKYTYENIRVGGDFRRLENNIELRNKHRGYTDKVIKTGINFAVLKSNYKEIEKLPEFARVHNFDFINLLTITNFSNSENLFCCNDEEVMRFMSRIKPLVVEKSKRLGIKLNYWLTGHEYYDYCKKACLSGTVKSSSLCSKNAGPDGVLYCLNPWKRMLVLIDDVRFYCYCQEQIGNLGKNKLLEIWNSEMAQAYRRNMISNNLSMCDFRCILIPESRVDERFDL
jgi:sulfatase maturation enzyme AslB (radical SAM superfamily)